MVHHYHEDKPDEWGDAFVRPGLGKESLIYGDRRIRKAALKQHESLAQKNKKTPAPSRTEKNSVNWANDND